MANIQLTLNIDEANKVITINGFSQDLSINYASDVDFTQLVGLLGRSIESDTMIDVIGNYVGNDEKLNVIVQTIVEIVAKYNEVITPPDSSEVVAQPVDDLPF